MAHYLTEVGYTPQAWSNQVDTGGDHRLHVGGGRGGVRARGDIERIVAQSIESMKRAVKLRKKYAPPTTVSLVEQKTPART